jgi:hypothetical protein
LFQAGSMKALPAATLAAAFTLMCGAAHAGEFAYPKHLGPNQKIAGVAEMDDSSGEISSGKGTASGAINGDFEVDGANLNATLSGNGQKLEINFDHGDQALRGRLDVCVTPNSCTNGEWVMLWVKP